MANNTFNSKPNTFNSRLSSVKIAVSGDDVMNDPEILKALRSMMNEPDAVSILGGSTSIPSLPGLSSTSSGVITPSSIMNTNNIAEVMNYYRLNNRERERRIDIKEVPQLDAKMYLNSVVKPQWDNEKIAEIYDAARPYVGDDVPTFTPRTTDQHKEKDAVLKKVIDHANDIRSGVRPWKSIDEDYFNDEQTASPEEMDSLSHQGTAIHFLTNPFHDVHATYDQALRASEDRSRPESVGRDAAHAQALFALIEEQMRKSPTTRCPVCNGHQTGGMPVASRNSSDYEDTQEECPGGCGNTGIINFSSDPGGDFDLQSHAEQINAMIDRHNRFCPKGRSKDNPNDIGCKCGFHDAIRDHLTESGYDKQGNLTKPGLPADIVGISTGKPLRKMINSSDTHIGADSDEFIKNLLTKRVVNDEYREPSPLIVKAQTGNAGPDGMAPIQPLDFGGKIPERKAEMLPRPLNANVVEPSTNSDYAEDRNGDPAVNLEQQEVYWYGPDIDSEGWTTALVHGRSNTHIAEYLRPQNKKLRTMRKMFDTRVQKHRDRVEAEAKRYLTLDKGTDEWRDSAKRLANLKLKSRRLKIEESDAIKSMNINEGLESIVNKRKIPFDKENVESIKEARETRARRENIRILAEQLNKFMGTRFPFPAKRRANVESTAPLSTIRARRVNVNDGHFRLTANTLPLFLSSGSIMDDPSKYSDTPLPGLAYDSRTSPGVKDAKTGPERIIMTRLPSGFSTPELIDGYRDAIARGDTYTADTIKKHFSEVVKRLGVPDDHPDNILTAISSAQEPSRSYNPRRSWLNRMHARRAATSEPVSKVYYEPGEVDPQDGISDNDYLRMAREVAAFHKIKNPGKPELEDNKIEEIANAIKKGGHIMHGYKHVGLDYDEASGNY
jgi:anti-sigma28 factor (negative regulator of flagellin synthesis)